MRLSFTSSSMNRASRLSMLTEGVTGVFNDASLPGISGDWADMSHDDMTSIADNTVAVFVKERRNVFMP